MALLEESIKEKIEIITINVINLPINEASVIINESRIVILDMIQSLNDFSRDSTFGSTSIGIIIDHMNELCGSFTYCPDYSSSERLNCLKILRYIRMSLRMYDDKYEYINDRINDIIGIRNKVK